MLTLPEFNIWYQPVKAVKGQALADLIIERINTNIATLFVRAWAMYFDGSTCEDGCGICILLVSPQGVTYSFPVRLSAPCTNNLAEYEAVRKGMELLLEAGAEAVEVFGDSKLVISRSQRSTNARANHCSHYGCNVDNTIQVHKFLLDTKITKC
jgi:ribonuclease HI